jgi:HK97 family phage portal protein
MKLPRWMRRSLDNPAEWLITALGSDRGAAGQSVNEVTALNVAAVWACVRVISEGIASLPLVTYRRTGAMDREAATDHWLFPLLHDQPNDDMTAMVFRETMQQHVLTWGNGYAEIIRNPESGIPEQLLPLPPDRVEVTRGAQGVVGYQVREVNTRGERRTRTIVAGNVLHIPGLSYDGLVGYSPVKMAAETIGAAMGAEKYGASLFGNSAKPAVILKHPGSMKKEAHENFKAGWDKMNQGASKANQTIILEEGMDVAKLSFTPEESQFLSTRKFSVEEIARWYNVPPHKIQHLDNATFSNIEHQGIDFVVGTLRPWMVRWEQEIKRKLLMPQDRGRIFAEHNADGLLRGDSASRAEFLTSMVAGGLMQPDEARAKENLPPQPGGARLYMQASMAPLENLGAAEQLSDEPPDIGARLLGTYRPVMADAIRRLLTLESDRASRALKRGDDAWATRFYTGDHPEKVRGALIPPIEACVDAYSVMAGATVNPEAVATWTASVAARHCDTSRQELADDPDSAITRWRGARVEADTDQIMLELQELCHAS